MPKAPVTRVYYEVHLHTVGFYQEHVGKLPPLRSRELKQVIGKQVVEFISGLNREPTIVVKKIVRKKHKRTGMRHVPPVLTLVK